MVAREVFIQPVQAIHGRLVIPGLEVEVGNLQFVGQVRVVRQKALEGLARVVVVTLLLQRDGAAVLDCFHFVFIDVCPSLPVIEEFQGFVRRF